MLEAQKSLYIFLHKFLAPPTSPNLDNDKTYMGRSFQMQELHDRVGENGRSRIPSSLPSVCLIPPLQNQCPQISVKNKELKCSCFDYEDEICIFGLTLKCANLDIIVS